MRLERVSLAPTQKPRHWRRGKLKMGRSTLPAVPRRRTEITSSGSILKLMSWFHQWNLWQLSIFCRPLREAAEANINPAYFSQR